MEADIFMRTLEEQVRHPLMRHRCSIDEKTAVLHVGRRSQYAIPMTKRKGMCTASLTSKSAFICVDFREGAMY